MPATIKYSDNPNEETAFVTQEGGQRSRAVLTAAVDGTIEYPDNPNSTKVMVTVDGVKRRAVAVANIAGGSGDSHNKGYYATQAALEEAHPTGEAGDYAIVGSTDTVWLWDTDNSAWVDSDTKGEVTSVNNRTGAVTVSEVPDQTGQSGKFLTTDGTDASWSDKPIINNINNVNGGISILGSSSATGQNSILIGANAGAYSNSDTNCIVVGATSKAATNSIAMGNRANADANACVQINLTSSSIHNTDTGTVKIANGNGNFEIMSADGTIPEARLADTTSAQQGDVLTLDANGDAVWQAGGGGSSYTAGTGIDITNNVISVTDPVLINSSYNIGTDNITIGGTAAQVYNGYSINIGGGSEANGYFAVALGNSSTAKGSGSIAIGPGATAGANALTNRATTIGNNICTGDHSTLIGSTTSNTYTLSDSDTFAFANNNGMFKLVDANGNIPTARLTKVNTTVTLAAADWSSNTQTVTVSGVKADSVVFVSPAPASASDYASAGILCTAQAADSLTFTCTTTPSNAITVNVICM